MEKLEELLNSILGKNITEVQLEFDDALILTFDDDSRMYIKAEGDINDKWLKISKL